MSKKLVHGGDWAGFEREFCYEPLDFSANVSPLGVPDGVVKAICDSAKNVDRYPDPLCRSLREAIAGYEGVESSWIACGNGAADIIFRLALSGKGQKALVTAPTFSEYETALKTCGCTVERYTLSEESSFRVDDGFLDRIDSSVDMVFLCEPNNPTGVTSGRDFLIKALKKCEEAGALLVIDECFNEFIDDPESMTMKGALKNTKNLFILKAFTKVFAMAGVRLGYCICSNEDVLDGVMEAGQPWSVSEIAQEAGVAALRELTYVKELRDMTRKERTYLVGALEGLGLKVIHGEANYLLFKAPADLDERLRKRGVLIRNCSNYPGLGEGWFRTAVRTHDDNVRLIEILTEELK
jgi:threonine-phosphate decarboxylase